MKKVLLFLLLFTVSVGVLHAQEYDASIEDAFSKYRQAYLSVDRAKLVEMSHPNIVEMGGGTTYLIEEITQDYNMYASLGLALMDLTINKPSKVLKVDDSLQAMLPYERTLEKEEDIISEKGFFLIISEDDGESWSFTDMRKYDAESIKVFIPNYNERLNIYINSINH